MQLIVAHNPTAGAGDWSALDIDRLLRAAGHIPHIESSKRKWPRLLRETADAFVAAGGDGTVHRVLHALEGRDVPVAILPTGTANNVAHAFGYHSGDDLHQRIARWTENERALRLARVERNGTHQLFVETVGVGVFGEMLRRPGSGKKKSPPAQALAAVREHLAEQIMDAEPVAVGARVDGIPTSGEYLLLECLNLPYFGPRLRVAPDQTPDSGTITLCGVHADLREKAAHWVRSGEGSATDFFVGRGTRIEIEGDVAAHVDGDPWPDKKSRGGRLRIQAGAQTIRIWV